MSPGAAIGTATRESTRSGDAPSVRATTTTPSSSCRNALTAACRKNGAATKVSAITTATVVKVGVNGKVCIYNEGAGAHVLADVTGYRALAG